MEEERFIGIIRSTVKCSSCAHKGYCEVGAECSNEGYKYHFPLREVRELDGSYTYFRTRIHSW